MLSHAPTVIRIRRFLYAIIPGRKYSIICGSNNYFYRSCQFRFEYINVLSNIHERFLNCYTFLSERHLTTTSITTNRQFDFVNSPISILLAPIEKPNIPSSIDTLNEQKTDKKPKDQKKEKKSKIIQDNNVLI